MMRAGSLVLGCSLAAAAGWYGLGSSTFATSQTSSGSFTCTVASVHDGDTFTCQEADASGRSIRVRLAGVDARELGDYCARGHPCSPAHAAYSTAALVGLTLRQRLSCRANGSTYGRTAAFCTLPDGRDLSCVMLQGGFVAIWPRYWGGHRC